MTADTISSTPRLSPEVRRMIRAACIALDVPVAECTHKRWQSDIRFGRIGFYRERCLECGYEREREYEWHIQERHLQATDARKVANQREWRRNEAARDKGGDAA